MKTEHLEYFADLAESGSLSKTAERFFTSHQVVKKAIKHLEDELAVKFIETSNQGSELTEAGKLLLAYAQRVLEETQEFKQSLLPYQTPRAQKQQSVIEFCMTPYLTDSMILSFIDEYQSRKPEITLALQSLPVQNMYAQLTNPYTISLIPTIEEATQDEQFVQALGEYGLDFFVLAERPLYICTYEKTKWAQRTFYTAQDLAEVPTFVSSSITLNTNFMRAKNQQMVNSIVAQKSLIKKGTGVTLVTKKEFAFYFKSDSRYLMIPTDLEPVWYICIHQKGVELPDDVQDFLQQLENVF